MAPQFVLVKTTSPRKIFGRAGLRFTQEWRPLRVADVPDLNASVIDAGILARLEAETEMLAVKPATEAELTEFVQAQASGPRDPAAELAELRGRNADLEGRLMRLEFASDRPAPESAELAELKARNAELEGRLKSADAEARARNAELEARLARLEAGPTAPMAAPAAPVAVDKKPAAKG